MITKEMLEARLLELKAERQSLINNSNAFTGAIQDCEYWLEQLATPPDGEVACA